MKIALLGTGKMGREVARIAPSRGHMISDVTGAEVCIDFSHPDAVLSHAETAASHGTDLVIGTTGWDQDKEAVQKLVLSHDMGCVFASNFSLGVTLFRQILSQAAALIEPYDHYDAAGIEMHHNQKVDSPSGTAIDLAHLLRAGMPSKSIDDFTSVRCGHIPGTHTIVFDSEADAITLTHQAKNRSGFALGALIAAEMIRGEKGWWTFEELIAKHSFVASER